MKFKFALFIFGAVIAKCHSADDGGCGLEGPNLDWTSGLCLFDAITDVDTLNEQFTFTDTLEVTNVEGSASLYLDIEVDPEKKLLFVKTNDNFNNFDNDTPTSATKIIISMTATLKCPNGDSKLTFSLPVEDTNNNKPTFLKPAYNYDMPTTCLSPKIDVTIYGESIIAEDLDFSNTKITFTVDPSDVFQVESVPMSDGPKQYRTSLTVAQYQTLSEKIVLTITATDDGTPQRTDTTIVTIKGDENCKSPDIPTFKETIYKFEYSESEGIPAIRALGDLITVITSDVNLTDVAVEANDFVKVVFDRATSQVLIDTTGTPIGMTSKSVMLFTLTVTLNKNAAVGSKTMILLEIPNDKVISVPKFSKPFYTAQYLTDSDSHTIKLDDGQEISTTKKEDVYISLSSDDHFSMSYAAGNWQVNVMTNLEEDILKKGGYIMLTLEARVKDSSVNVEKGHTALVVRLPEVKIN